MLYRVYAIQRLLGEHQKGIKQMIAEGRRAAFAQWVSGGPSHWILYQQTD